MEVDNKWWVIIIVIYLCVLLLYVILRSKFIYEHHKRMYMHDYLFISASTLLFVSFFSMIISDKNNKDDFSNPDFDYYPEREDYKYVPIEKKYKKKIIPKIFTDKYKFPEYKRQPLIQALNTGVTINGYIPDEYKGNVTKFDDQLSHNLYQDFYNGMNLDRNQYPNLLSYQDESYYQNYVNHDTLKDGTKRYYINDAEVMYSKSYPIDDPNLTPQQLAADPNHYYRDYLRQNNIDEAYSREINDYKRKKIDKLERRNNRILTDNLLQNIYTDRSNYEDKNYWYDYE